MAPTELSQRIERQLRVTYNVPGGVKISMSAPRASEFPNYDATTVTFDGEGNKQNYEFLLSKDQKTLMRLTKIDITKDPYQEIINKIDVKARPVRGNPNAKVVMVNYDDFECPFCSRVHSTLFPQLLKEYGDRVAFIYKDFPLSEIHPWAIHASVDANCIAAQNADAYWDFADYIHSNQSVVNKEANRDAQFAALDHIALNEGVKFKLDSAKLQACVKDQKSDVVTASVKEGEALGVTGTPTMFVNGEMMDGARSLAEIRSLFDSALQRAGVPPGSQKPASAAPAAPQPSASAGSAAQK